MKSPLCVGEAVGQPDFVVVCRRAIENRTWGSAVLWYKRGGGGLGLDEGAIITDADYNFSRQMWLMLQFRYCCTFS